MAEQETNRLATQEYWVGWDIGGAHLKVAYLVADKLHVQQYACPLWKGIDELQASMQDALQDALAAGIDLLQRSHAITMTGELVDAFSTRNAGVHAIIDSVQAQLEQSVAVRYFNGQHCVSEADAKQQAEMVASANWLASGCSVAQALEQALFVDIGSTTTDLLRIKGNQLQRRGNSDFERMRNAELVYTGVVRSCPNTLCTSISFDGQEMPLVAEQFAVTADVYRILEQLPAHADYSSTMDGAEKNQHNSMRRLARMVACDYEDYDATVWQQLAQDFALRQRQLIVDAVKQQIVLSPGCKILVGAGVGRFLLPAIADELGLAYLDFASAVLPVGTQMSATADDCAPAIALATLQHSNTATESEV